LQARTRVKICGITHPDDAYAAAALWTDAVGFVFYAPSPRHVDVDIARDIAQCLPAFVSSVGLFVNAAAAEIRAVLDVVPLTLLQFHGDETPEFCTQFGKPFLKAIRMKPDVDVTAQIESFSAARGILLDAYRPGVPGGTGETFDWQRVPRHAGSPIIVAGGLTAANVGAAIRATRPWAVDVSGGVEVTPGRKDHDKLKAFFAAVRLTDEEQ
jgi:phosphoribosylanthranilate isomerase